VDDTESGDAAPADLRVAGRIPRCVVVYVHEACGDAAVAELERLSGIGAEALHPAYDGEWVTAEQLTLLVEAAATLCGDDEIGRRAGEVSFALIEDLYPMFLGTGSVSEAVSLAVSLSNKTRTAEGYGIVETDDRSLIVHTRAQLPTRFACEMSAAFWAGIPTLFGATGYVTEQRCQARGDEQCEYLIRWTNPRLGESAEAEKSRKEMDTHISRFELMHTMAAELAQQESVAALLHLIAARASSTVTAPSVVVAVRLAEGDDLSIGYLGLSDSDAFQVALALESGLYEGDPSAIVVEVRSARRSYGHLAIFNQPDTVFNDSEKRMLEAFAGFATASIETAAALESARIERDRAESLLGLAKLLAEVDSSEAMVQRIAEAVPNIVRCAQSAVSLWYPDERVLETIGAWPSVENLEARRVSVDSHPGALRLVEGLVPVIIDRQGAMGDEAGLLHRLDAHVLAVAPIVVRGELLGTVTAKLTDHDRRGDVEETLRRLSGLADHAGAALDNSRLLDEVRHRALHDSLTGLPNRSLAEDRVRHALSIAERSDRWVTLLFVDLDEFKAVNDRLGHAAGDQLLREAADRLRRCVRTSDTVCRLGGDEFLVLLENTTGDDDGSRVAEEIIEGLREPFLIGGEVARVSASIGITSAPGRGTTYDELLARADEAMYDVKRKGRDGWAVYGT